MDFNLILNLLTTVGTISSVYFPAMKKSKRCRLVNYALIVLAIFLAVWTSAFKLFSFGYIFNLNGSIVKRILEIGPPITNYFEAGILRIICLVKIPEIISITQELRLMNRNNIRSDSSQTLKFSSKYFILFMAFSLDLAYAILSNFEFFGASGIEMVQSPLSNSFLATFEKFVMFQMWGSEYCSYLHDVLDSIVRFYSTLLVVVLVHGLSNVVDTFCNDFIQEIQNFKTIKAFTQRSGKAGWNKADSLMVESVFEAFQMRGKRLGEVFKKVHGIVGPCLLVIMPKLILITIVYFYTGLTSDDTTIILSSYRFVALGLANVGVMLSLIDCGHMIHNQLKTCHQKLKEEVLAVSNMENIKPMDRLNYLIDWDWTLTACGFFTLDRHIVSTITATTLTYMIVLVQFHLSDPRGPPTQGVVATSISNSTN